MGCFLNYGGGGGAKPSWLLNIGISRGSKRPLLSPLNATLGTVYFMRIKDPSVSLSSLAD